MREGAVICLFGMLAAAPVCGAAVAPVPPTLREADVVVVGGTVDGVRAAIAAKAAGASVFLVAPRAYLGEDRAATFQLERLPSDDPSDPVIREIFNPLYAKPVPLAATLSTNAADAARIVLTADLGSVQPISGVSAMIPVHVRQDATFRKDAPDLYATSRVVIELSNDGTSWKPFADLTRADNAYGQRMSLSPFERRAAATCRYVRAVQHLEADYPRQEPGVLHVLAPVSEKLCDTVTPFLIKRGLDKSMLAAGVPFRTGFPATDILRDTKGNFAGVVVASRNGFQSVRAKVLIDATVRGRLAARAGGARRAFPAGDLSCTFTVADRAGKTYVRDLMLPFTDGSALSFLAAEQTARDRTWMADQADSADRIAYATPDTFTSLPDGVFVVGPCAEKGTDAVAVGRAAGRAALLRGRIGEAALSPLLPLPVLASYDVVVAGGGTGGAPAGIAAARQGAKTLVLEFMDRLGGQTTEGCITGYYFGNRVGFTKEIDAGCKATGKVPYAAKGEWYRRAIREAGGDVWFGSFAAGVETKDGRVTAVIAVLPDGTCGRVLCKTAIDATGNADLAASAGCETEFITADELSVQGVGQAPQYKTGGGRNTDVGFLNDADAEDLWFFGLRARLSMPDNTWDQAQIPGSRERRRLIGAFYVTPYDVMLERTYPDTICRTYSNFDTHGQTRDPQFFVVDPPHAPMYVNLPYRALLPKKLDGLLVTGLGMSAHRDAMPILRMVPDVQNQGYAAGVASAMAVAAGVPVRSIRVKALQHHLAEKGIIPFETLEMVDSFPPKDAEFDRAIRMLPNDYEGLAVLMSDPVRSIPRLKEAWRTAESPDAKLVYAHVLGMMGDRTGEATLLAKFESVSWDKGWNFRGMSQFMRSVSWTDSYAIALGRSRSFAARPALDAKAAALTADMDYSHFRALALAYEGLGDPAGVQPLVRLLRLPGVGGHALRADDKVPPIRNYSNREGDRERTRVLKELCLARAIFNLGDTPDGLGRRTLEAYAADPRRAYAAHARLVLSTHAAPSVAPHAEAFVLENDAMRILFADARRGYGVTGIVNKVAGDVRFLRDTTREIDLWQVFFAKEQDRKRVECKEVSNRSPAKRRIERDGNRTTFIFEGIDLPDEPGAVDVRATVELEPGMGGSLWTLEVTNRSRVFGLTRTKYPVLKRVTDDGAGDVMMPSVNFGAFIQRKRDSKKIPDPRMVGYMGYSPMVSAFNLGNAGLYVAAHDGAGHDKYFDLKGEQNVSFYTPVENMGYVGRAGSGPGYPVCVACYKGDWWQAAKLYRKFALRQVWTAKGPICRRADYPKTMSETPLWINIHGDSDVATNTLAAAKKVYPDFATGLHWHRWNLPGHDVNYPEYFPTVPGVSNAVAACRAMGQMPMIYTNGRLWDAGTMGWRFAQPYATVQDDGKPYIERYGNKRAQGVMCPYTREWQDVMNELARRITGPEVGAPGLFMDQIGAAAPKLCFNPAHGHALGGGTYWFDGYRKLLAQAHATTFANGAFLTTEGSAEPWMDNIDAYLIVTMRRAEDVPFYPAVYSGYTTYFCSPQHGQDDETSWRYLQTREAFWGVELGWFSPSFLTAPGMAAQREIVGTLCRLRMKYKDFLAYGTLLDEARFAAAPARVPIKWRPRWVNRGKPQEFDAPAVIGNLWRNSADTETRLFLANISDAEQAVTLANDGFAGRTVTLPPHALEILRLE